MADITLGNLYDFNKQAYANEKPLDPIQFNLKINEAAKDIFNRNSNYWMLLCKERSDFTVFQFCECRFHKEIEDFRSALKETINNRGQLLEVEKQDDGNYEIWIRDPENNENFAYYLFDYSFGIVKIGD